MADLATLRFVELAEQYIPEILEIEQEANSAPWSDRSFKSEMGNPDKIFLVALVGGKVVGYGGVWLIIDEAHVTTVAVAVDQRRNGIGRKLVVELLNRARAAKMACSTLECRASNEGAVELYKRLGFSETARRRQYYPDNNEDAVVMWLFDLPNWEAPRK